MTQNEVRILGFLLRKSKYTTDILLSYVVEMLQFILSNHFQNHVVHKALLLALNANDRGSDCQHLMTLPKQQIRHVDVKKL